MTGPAGRRVRWVWWLVAAGAVVVLVAGGLTLLGGGGSHPHATRGTPTPSASGPSQAPSGCELRVVESGFGRHDPPSSGDIQFGFIVANPCQQAAVDTRLDMTAVDAAGNELLHDNGRYAVGDITRLRVVLPGQRMALAGLFQNGRGTNDPSRAFDPAKVAGIRVKVVHSDWQPAADVPRWSTATAEDATLDGRRDDGYVRITFRLRLDPPGELGSNWICVVMRDGSGRIVSAQERTIDTRSPGAVVHTEAWAPPDVAGLHADIFFLQWEPERSTHPCR